MLNVWYFIWIKASDRIKTTKQKTKLNKTKGKSDTWSGVRNVYSIELNFTISIKYSISKREKNNFFLYFGIISTVSYQVRSFCVCFDSVHRCAYLKWKTIRFNLINELKQRIIIKLKPQRKKIVFFFVKSLKKGTK